MPYPKHTGLFLLTLHSDKPDAFAFDPGDGKIDLIWPEKYGPKPSAAEVEAWQPSAFDKTFEQLAGAEGIAAKRITALKTKTLLAMVGFAGYTEETVNAEGSRFVLYHAAKISAFKDAGGNPVAGQALYQAVAESVGEFPWLDTPMGPAGSPPILALFAQELT